MLFVLPKKRTKEMEGVKKNIQRNVCIFVKMMDMSAEKKVNRCNVRGKNDMCCCKLSELQDCSFWDEGKRVRVWHWMNIRMKVE